MSEPGKINSPSTVRVGNDQILEEQSAKTAQGTRWVCHVEGGTADGAEKNWDGRTSLRLAEVRVEGLFNATKVRYSCLQRL